MDKELVSILAEQGGVSRYFDNDDRDATCTLFVGNLDHEMDRTELRKIFENYGVVEDIEIKRHMPVSLPNLYTREQEKLDMTKTYSFVKYEDMSMSQKAKIHLNGKMVGRSEIKIGYGNCLFYFCFLLLISCKFSCSFRARNHPVLLLI